MNNESPQPSTHSRVLMVAGASSFCAVAIAKLLHGSPTLVLSVGLAALLLTLSIGQFVQNRFRLGLRSLILLFTVAAVLFAIFGARMNEARIQRNAVDSVLGLRSVGGVYSQPYSSVHYEYVELDSDFFTTKGGWLLPIWLVDMLGKDFFFDVHDISIQNQDLSAEDSLDGVQLDQFASLYISNCHISDGAIRRITQQKQIRELRLVHIELTDSQLARIVKNMPQLERFEIGFAGLMPGTMGPPASCSVTNAGIRHLATLTELTELTINRTKATGACLEHLATLPKLQHFGCSGLVMTDSEVELFRDFKSLKSIVMYDTCVDEEWIPFLETLSLEWVAFSVADKSRIDEIQERDGRPIFSVN